LKHVLSSQAFQPFHFPENQNPLYETEQKMKDSDGQDEIGHMVEIIIIPPPKMQTHRKAQQTLEEGEIQEERDIKKVGRRTQKV